MNWSAVVASLVYLASQVRAGTKALKTTMRNGVFRSIQEWNLSLTADAEAAEVFQRGCRDIEQLTEQERYRCFHILYSFFKLFGNVYLHAVDGSIDRSRLGSQPRDFPCLCVPARRPGVLEPTSRDFRSPLSATR